MAACAKLCISCINHTRWSLVEGLDCTLITFISNGKISLLSNEMRPPANLEAWRNCFDLSLRYVGRCKLDMNEPRAYLTTGGLMEHCPDLLLRGLDINTLQYRELFKMSCLSLIRIWSSSSTSPIISYFCLKRFIGWKAARKVPLILRVPSEALRSASHYHVLNWPQPSAISLGVIVNTVSTTQYAATSRRE